MKLELIKLPKSKIKIKCEIRAEIFETYFSRAVEELGKDFKLDGFRTGAVPKDILLNKIPESVILEKMGKIIIKERYSKILQENKIDAIGLPEIYITKLGRNETMHFEIDINVFPEIVLPDYKVLITEEIQNFSKKDKKESMSLELKDKDEKNKEENQKRLKIVDILMKETNLELPGILVEEEIKRMKNFLFRMHKAQGNNHSKEEFDKNIKSLDEKIEKEAIYKLKTELILSEIAKLEKITVNEEEIKKDMDILLQEYKNINYALARQNMIDIKLREKVLNFLTNNNSNHIELQS